MKCYYHWPIMKNIIATLRRGVRHVSWLWQRINYLSCYFELAFAIVEMRLGDYGCCYWIIDHHMCNGCRIGSHG